MGFKIYISCFFLIYIVKYIKIIKKPFNLKRQINCIFPLTNNTLIKFRCLGRHNFDRGCHFSFFSIFSQSLSIMALVLAKSLRTNTAIEREEEIYTKITAF